MSLLGADGNMNAVSASQKEAITLLCEEFRKYNYIDPAKSDSYGVKRGLRNPDGTGVLAGVTRICNVHGYILDEGEKTPVDGMLSYRGIDVREIVEACARENIYGFEETAWLLLFGSLPDRRQLDSFLEHLESFRGLPANFVEDMIMKAPSPDIMNKLARAVLALYSYDDAPDDCSLENVIIQSVSLIARMPAIMCAAFQVKRHVYDHESLYIHPTVPGLSVAQDILMRLRWNKEFREEEAHLLDLCLILHAEHGGGNNSTFTVRSLTSSGTDTYAAIAGGIGSLKGPRHGGANAKVREMVGCIKANLKNPGDEGEIKDLISRIIKKELGDGSGLIYGMGHAVYTKSDPRCVLLKEHAIRLARGTAFEKEFELLDAIERLTPGIFAEVKGDNKIMCANVDLYSGLVYQMLGLPAELHTPLFALARTPGWCAHRLEELVSGGRIMRPAYKPVSKKQSYISIDKR